MDGRYRSVCECMKLLREVNLPPNEKYRLEADFIGIKVALLQDVDSVRVGRDQYNEQYFSDLLADVRRLAERGLSSDDFAILSSRLKPVISALSGSAPPSLYP